MIWPFCLDAVFIAPAANIDPPDCQLVCHVAVRPSYLLWLVEEGDAPCTASSKWPGQFELCQGLLCDCYRYLLPLT